MILEPVLVLATLLCSLVAGFLFAFAIVAMPGIGRLDDRSFIRAFQVIDGVIQDNNPIFMLVWVGSVITLVISAAIGFAQLDGLSLAILLTAAGVYVLGVQVPTALINIPLNNKIQTLRVGEMDDQEVSSARRDFELRWNRWNVIRSIVATAVAFALHVLLLRMSHIQLPDQEMKHRRSGNSDSDSSHRAIQLRLVLPQLQFDLSGRNASRIRL